MLRFLRKLSKKISSVIYCAYGATCDLYPYEVSLNFFFFLVTQAQIGYCYTQLSSVRTSSIRKLFTYTTSQQTLQGFHQVLKEASTQGLQPSLCFSILSLKKRWPSKALIGRHISYFSFATTA